MITDYVDYGIARIKITRIVLKMKSVKSESVKSLNPPKSVIWRAMIYREAHMQH